MHFEVEQKFRVQNLADIQRQLERLGACFGTSLHQVDRYFAHPQRDFSQTDEALRIRQVGGSSIVTYKGPKLDATTKTRQEIEVPLDEPVRSAELFVEILTKLGFRSAGTVNKKRRCAVLTWQEQPVEAALDDVEHLGTFLELELSADDTSLDAARNRLATLVAELQLGQGERRSYLEMVLEQMRNGNSPNLR